MAAKTKKPAKKVTKAVKRPENPPTVDLPLEERPQPPVEAEELREGFFISEQHFRQTMYRMLRDIQEAQRDQAELLGQLIQKGTADGT